MPARARPVVRRRVARTRSIGGPNCSRIRFDGGRRQLNQERTADILHRSEGYQRNNDDADEVLRGARMVEDTKTGERADVNLGDSDAIVDGLNRTDPNRYRQILLRDQ